MENQHRLIKGYKELTKEQIDLMNEVKQKGAELDILLQKLLNTGQVDLTWFTAGKLQLQQGLMAVTRSITKPDFF